MNIRTANGHDLFVVSSAVQKAIRRNNPALAGWAIRELFDSGYAGYAWRRLLVISAEDCEGIITMEVEALYRSQTMIQEKSNKKTPCGFIFIAKATLLLCRHLKNRDADHMGYLLKNKVLVSDDEATAFLTQVAAEGIGEIPAYVYDVHTREGRRRGKTKDQFWSEEHQALSPRAPGLFDNLIEESVCQKPQDAQVS